MTKRLPEWLQTMLLKYKAGVSHFFILWGNIYDLQKGMNGDYSPSIYQYLADIFEQRDIVMFYSLSSGLQFATEDMENVFRQRYLSASGASAQSGSVTSRASQMFQQNRSSNAPINSLLGDRPDQVFQALERALIDGENIKLALIVDSAHNLAPNNVTAQNLSDRINVEIFERWSRDSRINASGNLVLLLTPNLGSLADGLRSAGSSAVAIRIPKPDTKERIVRWKYLQKNNGGLFKKTVTFEKGLTADILGRITNGMSLKQIDGIYREAKQDDVSITFELVKHKKQEILNNEFGDRLKVKVPQWGFKYFGGKQNVKQYLLEVRDNILRGKNRRVPTGILASGPPGTGKTFLFECWAYECGFNFVEITNPRSMWVGKSEEMMESIFSALLDLAPVVVVEDEADQSETPRDVPNGDSGVSNRLRQMKFKFCSDPCNRGNVIWIRISNRDDLIDAAYKRKGRTDDNIPFVLPGKDEYASIFKVMFARYEIPTNISDFTPFAGQVAQRVYCTGADIEWMVLEADKYAGREGLDEVTAKHLSRAIDDWEMDLNPNDIDHQIILAIQGSSKRLRPEGWQEILSSAQSRLNSGVRNSSVFPGMADKRQVTRN